MLYDNFTEFCDDIGLIKNLENYKKCLLDNEDSRLKLFIMNMKKYSSRFDTLSMSYIQKAFENTGAVSQKITAVYPDGEIPNAIINEISMGIFDKEYSDNTLTEIQRKIINVLSVYYIISIN